MIFRKPYAFLIKYFRLINLLLSFLLIYIVHRLNLLRVIINKVYLGKATNYSNLRSMYVNFIFYLVIVLTVLVLIIIIHLLKRKKKPYNDYLFNVIYLVIIFIYLLSVSSLFVSMDGAIIEQTTLKLYTDISLLIIIPLFYFIIKYILIAIGFNIKKFNFTKDLIELKEEANDDEEVEVIFGKNTYKYKRFIRKKVRELKYYFLENKLFISIILGVALLVLIIVSFNANLFKSNSVNVKTTFSASGFNYRVIDCYETSNNLVGKNILKDYKFVISKVNIKNLSTEPKQVDLKKIRLIYGNDYVYATSYYNKYFVDLGYPYDNSDITSDNDGDYLLIFKVPSEYKSNNYKIKFYNGLFYDEDDINGSYKTVKIKAKKIDIAKSIVNFDLKNTIRFKENLGNSNLVINDYKINSVFIDGSNSSVVKPVDINSTLLILDYKMVIDENYLKQKKDFFNKFITVTYNVGENKKEFNNVVVSEITDNTVLLSVPLEVASADNLSLNIIFRDKKYVLKLK